MTAKHRTLEAIDAEIAETKAALSDVHGTQTEVYARIVGYYRAVRNWNKGTRDAFDQRKMFVCDKMTAGTPDETTAPSSDSKNPDVPAPSAAHGMAGRYEFFLRRTCPNCPPVKAYMADIAMDGEQIDVDTEVGLQSAAARGVFAAPTVIFYDAQDNEIGRAH
ncbi:MAG: hypothetical protein K2H73_04830, partial [Treponemataceae bacterium]|nr:hypothetical protein [Treponemataceae bacterium]